jgi:SAM-dependent methyltransferase
VSTAPLHRVGRASRESPVRGVPRACPVCAADAGVELFDNRMATLAGYDFSTPIMRCTACDSAYAGQALKPRDLQRYYSNLSKYDTLRTRNDVAALDWERASLASGFLAPILGSLGSVLDVGCASGVLLHTLREAGVERVRGIDPAADASAAARVLFDVAVGQAQAETYDDYGSHDLVCLMAVLEHLLAPRALLNEIGRQLKPGGRVLVEIPDAGAFDRPGDDRPLEPFGEFSNEHINFLSIADVCRLAAPAGLEVERWRTRRIAYGAPDLFVLLRRASADGSLPPPDAGSTPSRLSSGEAVQHYVARSTVAIEETERRLQAVCREPVLVYGAGNHTARLMSQSAALRAAEVLAVFDRNPHLQGNAIDGVPILPPERIRDFAGIPVIISTFNARHEIHAALSALTQQRLVLLYD